MELVILGLTGALQVFCAARSVLEPWRWLYYAFTMGSLLLVESMRRRAFHRLESAQTLAIRLLEQALALKAERNEGGDGDKR